MTGKPWFHWEFPRGGYCEISGDLSHLEVDDIGYLCQALLVVKRVISRMRPEPVKLEPLEFWTVGAPTGREGE